MCQETNNNHRYATTTCHDSVDGPDRTYLVIGAVNINPQHTNTIGIIIIIVFVVIVVDAIVRVFADMVCFSCAMNEYLLIANTIVSLWNVFGCMDTQM